MTFDISTKASVKIQIFSEKKFIYKNKSENVNRLGTHWLRYQKDDMKSIFKGFDGKISSAPNEF